MIDFTGKVILLTGACGGIGQAIAQRLFRYGAHLVLCDRDASALERLCARLRALPGQKGSLDCRVLDVTDPEACLQVTEAAAGIHDGIDCLVNAAGIYPEQTVSGMSNQQWRTVMAVNLDGIFYMCRAALPHLLPGSAIVNLASMAGHRGSQAHAHYAAAKGGVTSLGKSLARELAPRTRVNTVSPGIIETPLVANLVRERGQALRDATPLGRFGTADEVAGAVAFLCSDLASFVTGETLHVNGGLYIV